MGSFNQIKYFVKFISGPANQLCITHYDYALDKKWPLFVTPVFVIFEKYDLCEKKKSDTF